VKTQWLNNQLGSNLSLSQQELDYRFINDTTNVGDKDEKLEVYSISSRKHFTQGSELDISSYQDTHISSYQDTHIIM
jgi:hypothetical protein